MAQGARRIQRRSKARKQLDQLMAHPESVVVIHYSCESFYDRPDGSSPRITSIAVANLESSQTISFSIHQIAEWQGYTLAGIEEHYDQLEKLMLDEFYQYVRTHANFKWLHWNMRDIHYGFQAIAHRCRVLQGQPVEIHESQLYDLSAILQALYGPCYVGHPHLKTLIEKNEITSRDFLVGAAEATAFENKEYVKLHYSTLRKVNVLATIAQRADEGSLKTDSTWRDVYGVYPQAIIEWVNEHWIAQALLWFFAILGFIASIIQIVEFLT